MDRPRGPRRAGGGGRGAIGNGYYPDTEEGDKQVEKEAKAAEKTIRAEYKALLPAALQKAVKLGVDKDWAKKYFDDFLEEQLEFIEDEVANSGPKAAKNLMLEIKSLLKGDDVLADYKQDVQGMNIQQVKDMGEKLAKNPKDKIRILQKIGLNGAEFHALCLMIKEQIK